MRRKPATSFLHHKTIAQAPDGLDIPGFGGILLNFLPEAVDIDHDGIFIDDRLPPKHAVEHILGKNTIYIVHEQLHHGVFLGGEDDFGAILIEPQSTGIILERTCGDD